MPFTALTSRLGTQQGRLDPAGHEPTDGTYELVLGHDAAGVTDDFVVGDNVEAAQTANLDGKNYLRLRALFRPPATMPVGHAWEFSLWVAGVKRAQHRLLPGRSRSRVDLAANVSKLSGPQAIALRLAVVTA